MKLDEQRIAHHCWYEPDGDLGFTAIATIPLDVDRKQVLKHYRLWSSPIHPSSSVKEQAILTGEVGGLSPSWGANGPREEQSLLVKSRAAHQTSHAPRTEASAVLVGSQEGLHKRL